MFPIKKNITFIASLVFLGVILLIAIFFLNRALSHKNKTEEKLQKNIKTLERFIKTSKIKPSREMIQALKTRRIDLKEKYEELLGLLQRSNVTRAIPVPLEFKEELLKTQNQIKERAQLWNITIPKAIGFGEYEGGIIPEAKNIPVLVKQFELIKTIIGLLIECKITTLKRIVKVSDKPLIYTGKELIYETFTFDLSFVASYNSLYQFISKLNTAPIFFVVRQISIQKLNETLLNVDLSLEAILFTKKNKTGSKEK